MAPKKAAAPSTSSRETRTKTGKITPRQFPVVETKSETTRTKNSTTKKTSNTAKKPASKTKTVTKKTTSKKPAAKANTSAKVTKTGAKKKQPVKGAVLKAEGAVMKKPGKKGQSAGDKTDMGSGPAHVDASAAKSAASVSPISTVATAKTSEHESSASRIPQTPSPVAAAAIADAQKWLAQPVVASFIAGGVAGAVSRTVVSPLERLKILFQIQSAGQTEYKMSVPKALAKMWKEEGFKGFMRGNGTNCIRIVPYSAVQFGSYNFYKRVGLNFMVYEMARSFVTPAGEKNPGTLGKLAAGAVSGAVAQTCTYPFDVLRRRFQINTMSGMGYQYKSIWDAIRVIVSQEGIRGLYKGIVPNLLKVAPSMASSWASFELVRDLMVSLGKSEVL
ncbi:MAG: hypothetical protein Q9159_004686 [Coniocarpon cinnabarinum]